MRIPSTLQEEPQQLLDRSVIIMRAVLSTANQRDFHYKLAGTAVEDASAECSHSVYFVGWQCVQFSVKGPAL